MLVWCVSMLLFFLLLCTISSFLVAVIDKVQGLDFLFFMFCIFYIFACPCDLCYIVDIKLNTVTVKFSYLELRTFT